MPKDTHPTPTSPVSQVETITPKIAAALLEINTHNRPLSANLVAVYARDMKDGRWMFNGDAIRVSCEGVLLDGQHRLAAVVASDCTVPMLVVRGLPADVFTTLDAGRKRTAGDVLAIQGVQNYNVVAAAARFAHLFSSSGGLSESVSRTEVTDFVAAHPYILETSRAAVAKHGRLNPSPLAAVLFLANESRYYDNDLTEFLDGIADGEDLKRGDPRLTLREWATTERLRSRNQIVPTVCFAAVARAWTAYIRDEQLSLIRVRKPINNTTVTIAGYSPTGSRRSKAA